MVVTVVLYLVWLGFPRFILGPNSVSQGLRSSFYKQVPMFSSKLHTLGKRMGINYKLLININVDGPKAVLKYNSAIRKPHKVRESGSYLLKIRASWIPLSPGCVWTGSPKLFLNCIGPFFSSSCELPQLYHYSAHHSLLWYQRPHGKFG